MAVATAGDHRDGRQCSDRRRKDSETVHTPRQVYIVATVVLGLFAIGCATMWHHLTSAGVLQLHLHGLGRVVGMASGC